MRFSDPPSRRWQTSGGVTLLVLIAFAGGWLLRDCEPPPSLAAPALCPPAQRPPAAVLEPAPPCPPDEPGPARAAPARGEERMQRRLPALAPRDDDADRRALLAWVSSETPALRACTEARLRTTVRLWVNEQGEVERVALHPSSGELDRTARACLERILRAWRLPEALRSGSRELVFAVRL